jgi:C4-dicarboxylate-specific signal transduction histidine kinase
VILNLIQNAEDILLEKNIKDPIIIIKIVCNITSKTQSLIIEDNAGGIPKNIIKDIFKPYFSTKIAKDGSGLGLYMSKIIVEEHCNGKLSVLNNKQGATFIIEF